MPRLAGLVLTLVTLFAPAVLYAEQGAPAAYETPSPRVVERGRYIVKIAGCNDCHTPGYGESGGAVPESQWLTGHVLAALRDRFPRTAH